MKLGKSLSHSAFPAAGPPTGSESSLVPCMGFVIDMPHHHLPSADQATSRSTDRWQPHGNSQDSMKSTESNKLVNHLACHTGLPEWPDGPALPSDENDHSHLPR